MGKLVTYLSIIIFIEILFIATGQLGINSPTSVILDAILDPSSILSSKFFAMLMGLAGVSALLTTAGVTVGIINKAGIDILGFAGLSIALTAMAGDFITIYARLNDGNPVLATFIFAPLLMLFVMTVVEWLRGKD